MNSLATGLALSVFAAAAAAQSTWYVDINGTPPGAGTVTNPYTSIQYALNQPTTLQDDTVLVLPGVYPEDIVHRRSTLMGSNGPEDTVLTGLVTSEGWPIDGFTFRYQGLCLWNRGTISNCIFRDCAAGIVTEFDTCVTITNCTFVDNGIAIDDNLNDFCEVFLISSLFWNNGTHIKSGVSTKWHVLYCSFPTPQSHPRRGFNQVIGTIYGDPLLWNEALGDFHLKPGSPCIDAGHPTISPDPDGSRADIGALRFNRGYAPNRSSTARARRTPRGACPRSATPGDAPASSGRGRSWWKPSTSWRTNPEC